MRFENWEYEKNDTGITLKKYYGRNPCVTIPSSVESQKVTAIGNSVFYHCSDIVESVDMHETAVTNIDESAFSRCCFLEDIRLSPHLEEIGAYAFSLCISLKHICIPDSVTTIGKNAFEDCSSLACIKLPKHLQGDFVYDAMADFKVYPDYMGLPDCFSLVDPRIYMLEDFKGDSELMHGDFTEEWFKTHFPQGAANRQRIIDTMNSSRGSLDTRYKEYPDIIITRYLFTENKDDPNRRSFEDILRSTFTCKPHPMFGAGWFGNLLIAAGAKSAEDLDGKIATTFSDRTLLLDGAITDIRKVPDGICVTTVSFTNVDTRIFWLAYPVTYQCMYKAREMFMPRHDELIQNEEAKEVFHPASVYYCNLTGSMALVDDNDELEYVNGAITALKERYTDNYTGYEMPPMYFPDVLTQQDSVEAGLELIKSNVFSPLEGNKAIKIRLMQIGDVIEAFLNRSLTVEKGVDIGRVAEFLKSHGIEEDHELFRSVCGGFAELPAFTRHGDIDSDTEELIKCLDSQIIPLDSAIDIDEILTWPCAERFKEEVTSHETVKDICRKVWDSIPECMRETEDKMALLKQFMPIYLSTH